jgi:hypothetical protein
MCEQYKAGLHLVQLAYTQYPDLEKYRDFYFYGMLQLFHARILLGLNQTGEALRLFHSIRTETFYVDTRQYLLIQYALLHADLVTVTSNMSECLPLLEEALQQSRSLGFQFFEEQCLRRLSRTIHINKIVR